MAGTSFDINNGANQIAPNAMTQNQYFYGEEFARKILGSKDKPLSLVVLGAGVDATIGLPTSADLIPRIVDFLETDEGKTLDAILRKAIGRVHFHFDKFVSTAIDRLAKDLDREIVSICHNINDELANNASLDESQRKLGMLIVRLFKKVLDFKKGAEIDAETMNLIEEVFDTVVKDDSIIDLSHLNYTDTFKNIIVEILQKSIHESNNPILRHIYKNMLDIEQLLAGYFLWILYGAKQLYPRLSIHILDSMGILGKRGAAKGARECGCRDQRQPHYLRPIGRKRLPSHHVQLYIVCFPSLSDCSLFPWLTQRVCRCRKQERFSA